MDDTEQINIRIAITEVLPDLAVSIADILVETLQLVGVETSKDFPFIKEANLLFTLRLIPARRLGAV